MNVVRRKVPLLKKYIAGLGWTGIREKQKSEFALRGQEGLRLRTRPVLWLLKVLLGISLITTPLGVLSGESPKAVMALATPWMLWLMNELVWSVLGKYRGLMSLR
jgi:hypothetical protein